MTGEDWQQLAEVADLAEAVLVRASVQGTVAILTNAQVNWVSLVCPTFMPAVGRALDRLPCDVVYARKFAEGAPQTWKESALRRCAALLRAPRGGKPVANLVSVGDQTHEHDACRAAAAAPCVVKTVKLVERPTLADLAAQLRVVHSWLGSIAAYGSGIDLDLGSGASLADLTKLQGAPEGGGTSPHRHIAAVTL